MKELKKLSEALKNTKLMEGNYRIRQFPEMFVYKSIKNGDKFSSTSDRIKNLRNSGNDLPKPTLSRPVGIQRRGLNLVDLPLRDGSEVENFPNPNEFYSMIIDNIINNDFDYRQTDIIYNLFIRYACAFDHDGDGILEDKPGLLKENGTFLKAIAMLPYIKYLGADTVSLLPVCKRGKSGMKGNLGSPYAVSNPLEIDIDLADNIHGISVDEQFKAFVQAAHKMNIRVTMEFVFRTASRDSILALDHPEWFYWIWDDEDIIENYRPPNFENEVVDRIIKKAESGNLEYLPEPDEKYKGIFAPVPDKLKIEDGKIIGYSKCKRCIIPGAFADWPPNDPQPPWDDVTYLRLYNHPDFNYIAYNTIRMYDNKLKNDGRKVDDLWYYISNIIPHYIKNFDIDGVMIDMGHAIPSELMKEIVKKARSIKPDFIFFEENFNPDAHSVRSGYNASLGRLFFDIYNTDDFKNLLRKISTKKLSLPIFLAPETHNTPRIAARYNEEKYKCRMAASLLLPGLPYIHSGVETGEKRPVNTGLNFFPEESAQYPAEELPLFSAHFMNLWQNELFRINLLKELFSIREEFGIDKNSELVLPEVSNKNIIAFIITGNKKNLLFVSNFCEVKEIYFNLKINSAKTFYNYQDKRIINFINSSLILNLKSNKYYYGELVF